MNYEQELRLFVRRIRRALAWKFAGVGLFLGCLAALAAAVADYFKWLWFEWPQLCVGPLVGLIVGTIVGLSRRPSLERVAASIDRRAGLRDRMSSGLELGKGEHPFSHEVQSDAQAALASVDPKRLYPLGYLRWHAFALIAGVLTVGLVLLGNTPLFSSPQARQEKEEMKKQAEEVIKVVRPALKDPNLSKPSEEYAKNLEKYARELERARMDRKEALKKANDLANKGQDVKKELSEQLNNKLDSAQKTLEAMLSEQLQKNGQEATPEEMRSQLENMFNSSPEYDRQLQEHADRRNELNALRDDLQSRMANLQRQLDDPNLSPQDKKALEQAMRDLQAEMKSLDQEMSTLQQQMSKLDQSLRDQLGKQLDEDIQKEMAKLQKEMAELMKKLKMPGLSDAQKRAIEKRMKELQELMKQLKMGDLQKGIQELMNDPKMKAILQRMTELMKKAKFIQGDPQNSEASDPPKLTKEDIEALQKAIDEMAEKLKDADFRKKLLEDLKAALDSMKELMLQMKMCNGFCMGMGFLPGLPLPVGGPMHGGAFSNTNWVNKFDKGVKGEGTTLPTRVTGERHPTLGRESFIEVRGPAKLGAPSRIPYLKILPKYRQAAEEAMRKQKISKDQEKRVREYFRSLGGQ